MPHRIDRISPLSAAKLFGAMYFALGLLFAPFMMIPMLAGGENSGFGLGFALAVPILYGLGGFVGMAIVAWLYNLFAGWIGGIELEIVSTGEQP